MKISKLYLQKLIKEEILKEFKAPPKVKAKLKPKPEVMGMTFTYLLNGERKEYNFDVKKLKEEDVFFRRLPDEWFMWRLAETYTGIPQYTENSIPTSKHRSKEESYDRFRRNLLSEIPVLSEITITDKYGTRPISNFKLDTLKKYFESGEYQKYLPISLELTGVKPNIENGKNIGDPINLTKIYSKQDTYSKLLDIFKNVK